MIEKFYILGKLGDSDGFQVYDLKSKTTAQGEDYSFLETSFHKDGYKELFKISRKGYKTYYTYIKSDLSAKRPGCMLGFSYVYEDNGNVIKDFLGLRQKMKEALNHLLKGNGEIKITSFNDNSVNTSLKHIEDFTKKVNAEILPLSSNPTQFPTQNPNDLTNEKIWEMLKKSVNVEITEYIPTALSQKEQTIKTLTSQIQQLKSLNQQKDTEISNLKNEKDTLIKENEKLETQLTNANSNNSVRDRKILNAIKDIKSCLSTNEEIPPTPHPQKESKLKEVLPFFILILVIINIVIGVSNCSGNSKSDETNYKDEIKRLENERDELNANFEKLTSENSDLVDENNKLRTQLENPKKEEPAINDKDKEDKAKKEAKDTKKKQPSQDEKDYKEWLNKDNNREDFTKALKAYAEKNKKKYEDVNEDCKDCKKISKEEKLELWKKDFKK